jgi:hypothetical protein
MQILANGGTIAEATTQTGISRAELGQMKPAAAGFAKGPA